MADKITLISLALMCAVCAENGFKLQQVVILSRHNIRTPLAKHLSQMSPFAWPHWKEKSGELTAKGGTLEGYMGAYFSQWLEREGLLKSGCPEKDTVFIYANTKQRTIASAQSFADKAFPDCNVTVYHKPLNSHDPTFNPIVHNKSEVFLQTVTLAMDERLKTLNLGKVYEKLQSILDYKDSYNCKTENLCDLTRDKNSVVVLSESEPEVYGPLKIGNSAVDAFIMEYYEGFPIANVAWGKVTNDDLWNEITSLTIGYHNVRFNTTILAKDISEPLVEYMKNTFLSNTKITLLMGHDANICTVLSSMNFKLYSLPNQYEKTPIGGKLVFQKWHDVQENRDLLRINYVYQSNDQLRNGAVLSLDTPPQSIVLELEDCKFVKDSFCLWSDFEKILTSL